MKHGCSFDSMIRKVRSDFYSSIPETQRIIEAVKERLIDALIPLAGSDSKELQAYAAEIYRRFCDGTDAVAPLNQNSKPEVEVSA